MNDSPTATLEVVEPEQKEMLVVIQETGIQADVASTLQGAFEPLFKQARGIISQSRQVTVTDVSQTLQMKLAREYRLALKKIRIASEAKRKELKEESLKRGKVIDAFHTILLNLVDHEETRLDEAEKFAQRREDERLDAQKLAREEALRPYGVDTSCVALRVMPQEQFDQFLENAKLAHEARAEQARKAEAARIQAENDRLKEEQRIRDENAALKKQAEEREAAAKAEKERLEAAAAAERKKAADAKKKADAAAAKAKADADEAARVAAEKARAEAEAALEKQEAQFREQRKKEQDEAFAQAERVRKKVAADKAAADAKLAEERAEREKAEAASRSSASRLRRFEAEREAQVAQEEERQRQEAAKAAAAPDREKLERIKFQLLGIIESFPMFATPDGQHAGDVCEDAIKVCVNCVQEQANAL